MGKKTDIKKEENYKNMISKQDINITKYPRLLKVDLVFKLFFSRKGNEKYLISFLEAILDVKITKIEIIHEGSFGCIKPEDKWSTIDVKATVNNKNVIIEIQLDAGLEIARKSAYYSALLIANQLEPEETYSDLKDVILINILNFNLLKTPEYHTETVTVEKNNKDYELIPYIKYHFIELPKFRKNVHKITSKLEAWLAIIDCKDFELMQMARKIDSIFFDAIMEIDAILHNKELRYIID